MECLICQRIEQIRAGENRFFVREMETGYVVLGDHQFFRGYTLFLSKEHAHELHDLEPSFRKNFLWEMSEVAAAVFRAFEPVKLNYELLGNADPHLHWHLFPRHANDPEPRLPVAVIDKVLRDSVTPDDTLLDELRTKLQKAFL